jgi:hypothetical protein
MTATKISLRRQMMKGGRFIETLLFGEMPLALPSRSVSIGRLFLRVCLFASSRMSVQYAVISVLQGCSVLKVDRVVGGGGWWRGVVCETLVHSSFRFRVINNAQSNPQSSKEPKKRAAGVFKAVLATPSSPDSSSRASSAGLSYSIA